MLYTSFFVFFACTPVMANPATGDIVKISTVAQHDAVVPGTRDSAIAVDVNVAKGWHFYADKENAPGGQSITICAEGQSKGVLEFKPPIIPGGAPYDDEYTGTKTSILTDSFRIYVPFRISPITSWAGPFRISISVKGALCSTDQCRMVTIPAETTINIGGTPSEAKFALPSGTTAWASTYDNKTTYSLPAALGLALLAGIILNIMPCVLPVIPLKVLSIFQHAKESRFRCIVMGMAFCAGILLFFACIAAANIFLRVAFGSAFQWGDHFRNPAFVIGMAILMEVLALVMFGLATITVPGNVGTGAAKGGYAGSVATGFLAALLSTPCSFAILTAAFAWAQMQGLVLSTIAIMTIGIGMAAPYALLISMPALLKNLPRPGRWMEVFKQAMGFVLLIVAIWLLSVLPPQSLPYILYFAAVIAVCVWIWGTWVSYDSPLAKRLLIRSIAVIIALIAGHFLLKPALEMRADFVSSSQGLIEWQKYDAQKISDAIANNQPVLIDWTADWCLTCKAVEKTVYERADIQQHIKNRNVLAIKADTTWATNPAAIDLQKLYNEPGVPVQMLFVPGKKEPLRFRGLVIGEELNKALQEF